MENLERDLYKNVELILYKGIKVIKWKKDGKIIKHIYGKVPK